MIQNALAASLAAFVWGFKIEDIRLSLETFVPSAAHTPGRMNVFKFKDYTVLVDHAHNQDGLKGVKQFLALQDSKHFVGIISATGDRRDEDIRDVGRLCAEMFDQVVICQEKYLRGRTYENMIKLITEGLHEVKPDIPIEIIPNGQEALKFAMSQLRPGSYMTIVSDSVSHSVEAIQKLQDEEAGIKE